MDQVHAAAPAVAKRMWSYLRAVFFMARKGLLSNKRRMLVGLHLLVNKRRNKAVARTVANLLSFSHHHHHGGNGYHGNGNALRRREYEFSFSNSPGPRSFSYDFPNCLGAVAETTEDVAPPAATAALARIDRDGYDDSAAASPTPSSLGGLLLPRDLAPGEDDDFSVRVSNYSWEDDLETGAVAGSAAVDDDAEEFIRRFYEQLRRQNQIAMLPYSLQESVVVAC